MGKLGAVALLATCFLLGVDCHQAFSESASAIIASGAGIIPAERNFAWNPGLMSEAAKLQLGFDLDYGTPAAGMSR